MINDESFEISQSIKSEIDNELNMILTKINCIVKEDNIQLTVDNIYE
jgi:hypothetical protein